MKRFLLMLAAVVASLMALSAQTPVKWRMSVKMTSEKQGVITLRAVVEPGWHLYSTDLPEGGPRPTSISFAASKGIKLNGALKPSLAPKQVNDPMFEMTLSWWDTNVAFTQSFTLVDPKDAKVAASVGYMACNDQTCLPPKTENLTYIFK